jgi:proline iminopeptidase
VPGGESPGEYARAFARIENHFFHHLGWMESDGQLLDNVDRMAEIPGAIVQGRYDMICPPISAWRLSERWPEGELRMIGEAGHALSEPGISAELVKITNGIVRQAPALGL